MDCYRVSRYTFAYNKSQVFVHLEMINQEKMVSVVVILFFFIQ